VHARAVRLLLWLYLKYCRAKCCVQNEAARVPVSPLPVCVHESRQPFLPLTHAGVTRSRPASTSFIAECATMLLMRNPPPKKKQKLSLNPPPPPKTKASFLA
jgi:hypothetical protein